MAASKRRARVLVDTMVLQRVVRASGEVGEAIMAEEDACEAFSVSSRGPIRQEKVDEN